MPKGRDRFALFLAEFFYCGRSPIMPGTVGSLASLVIWVPSIYLAWPLAVKLTILALIFIVGVWTSGKAISFYQQIDPKQVVIDEVVGQGIPFLIISPNLLEIILAFLFFRFFDILKPWPIKWVERRFPDRFGIMLDDVVAGFFALIAILLIKWWTDGLGG